MKIKNIPILVIFPALFTLILGACKTVVRPDPFVVDLKSPSVEIGKFEVQVDPMLSFGLRKIEVDVSYFPDEDAVCLQYKVDFFTFYQFWSRDGRDMFISALASYNEAYEARTLATKGSRRTRRQYGISEGYLIWQMFAYTIQAKANVKLEIGYTFSSRSPYFSVYQKEAVYTDPVARDNDRTSTVVPFLFTREQAHNLAELFSPEFLSTISLPENARRSGGIEADEYFAPPAPVQRPAPEHQEPVHQEAEHQETEED
jgi:hypothetical protein